MLLGEFNWANFYRQLIHFKNLAIWVRSVLSKMGASHFCSQAKIAVRSQESGARRKEEEGRRKEPEEVFLQI